MALNNFLTSDELTLTTAFETVLEAAADEEYDRLRIINPSTTDVFVYVDSDDPDQSPPLRVRAQTEVIFDDSDMLVATRVQAKGDGASAAGVVFEMWQSNK